MKSRSMLVLAAVLAAGGCASATGVSQQPLSNLTGDYLAAKFSAEVNAIDEAAAAFARAADASADRDLLGGAFFYLLAAGNIEAAIPYAERLVAAGDDVDGLAALTLMALDLRSGDADAAEERVAAAPKSPLGQSLFALSRAWIASEREGPAAALAQLEAAREPVFTGFNATFRAILKEQMGDLDGARADHEASIYSLSGPIGREAYGAFLERRGDADAARAFYMALLKEGGANARLGAMGLARLDGRRPSKSFARTGAAEGAAITFYLFAGNILDQSAGERRRASEAGYRIGEPRYHLPLALANLAVFLDPGLDNARALAGGIFSVYDEFALAERVLAPIAPSSHQFESAQMQIAAGRVAQDRVASAIASLEAAIKRDPDAEDARLALAGYLASDGQYARAIAAAGKAIDRLPEPPPSRAWRLYVTRADALLKLDRWPEAESDLKRAVEIAPDDPTTLNYLGYSWAERGVNLDEAFAMIEKAVAREPGVGAYVDSLGWAHYQRGDYAAAVTQLERAVSLEPGDPTICDHLGDAYWRLGRLDEARYQWSHALKLDPDAALKAALERKLLSGLSDAKAPSRDTP